MEGVLERKKTGITTKLRTARRVLKTFKSIDEPDLEFLNAVSGPTEKTVYSYSNRRGRYHKNKKKIKQTETLISKLEEVVDKLRRASELEKEFNIVERDDSVKKKIKHPERWKANRGEIMEIPLIFHTKIPCKTRTSIQKGSYKVTSKTPTPTAKASSRAPRTSRSRSGRQRRFFRMPATAGNLQSRPYAAGATRGHGAASFRPCVSADKDL